MSVFLMGSSVQSHCGADVTVLVWCREGFGSVCAAGLYVHSGTMEGWYDGFGHMWGGGVSCLGEGAG